MVGDEFKIREPRYYRPVIHGNTGGAKVTFDTSETINFCENIELLNRFIRHKPFYKRIRTYVYAAGLLASFYAGAYYNAWRQVDAVLPPDTSVVRDLGYVAPAEYRLEVGML